jgi:hypothetical protein
MTHVPTCILNLIENGSAIQKCEKVDEQSHRNTGCMDIA